MPALVDVWVPDWSGFGVGHIPVGSVIREFARRALTQLRHCNVNGRWQHAVCFRLAQWTYVQDSASGKCVTVACDRLQFGSWKHVPCRVLFRAVLRVCSVCVQSLKHTSLRLWSNLSSVQILTALHELRYGHCQIISSNNVWAPVYLQHQNFCRSVFLTNPFSRSPMFESATFYNGIHICFLYSPLFSCYFFFLYFIDHPPGCDQFNHIFSNFVSFIYSE